MVTAKRDVESVKTTAEGKRRMENEEAREEEGITLTRSWSRREAKVSLSYESYASNENKLASALLVGHLGFLDYAYLFCIWIFRLLNFKWSAHAPSFDRQLKL